MILEPDDGNVVARTTAAMLRSRPTARPQGGVVIDVGGFGGGRRPPPVLHARLLSGQALRADARQARDEPRNVRSLQQQQQQLQTEQQRQDVVQTRVQTSSRALPLSLPSRPHAVRDVARKAQLRKRDSARKTRPTCFSREVALDALLCPETLVAAGAISVGRIGLVSRAFKAIAFDGADPALGEVAWRCACQSLRREFALWCPEPVASSGPPQSGYWQKLFFQQLWPARSKWALALETHSDSSRFDFAIQVSLRFKPGDASCGPLLVPLHQKLMALRSSGETHTIGQKEPPEFLDALMGHVMRDAVRLPGSGRVCERSVIESQLRLHGPRDPFDGSGLHASMLEPQEELTARIQEWRVARLEANAKEDNMLDENQIRQLIKELGGDLDPEVVEMLLEADQLRIASKRAVRDATEDTRTWNDDMDMPGVEDEGEPESVAADDADVGDAWWEQRDGPAHVLEAEHSRRRFVWDRTETEEEVATKREGARVVLVAPPTRVIMFANGTGIRPFVFTRVFDGDARQD